VEKVITFCSCGGAS